ncbi:nad(p)h-dependent fmn-containing oxidoreductase ywqn-related [Anaeramoeba flamelloides]|uniref:Nad(P)h-dependent fmn-containing oxidoreductase ywqn-related n=1 Tax=Anaeramoeba flamelloides TaxID=1746091 RepID=A0AAV7Z7G3_9EUKA|nr:nad(p)h-dependent fmn-containing oxidoreductase ywqn-related [Anaeramoeba flamelloides]KAJ6244596.1 nad(p)h-dependent fmn-containing oxidoreductase ywqn-related [Anaeramoeba flamelloides]
MHNLTKPLKVIAFNGSPNKKGNTFHLIQHMFKKFNQLKVETELVQIGSEKVYGCRACGKCGEMKNYRCIIEKDSVNKSIEKIRKSDGIILATPVYLAGPTGRMKCFIDRVGYVARHNYNEEGHSFLWHKACSGVSVHARGGATNTLSQLNYLFSICGGITTGSISWNYGVGHKPGDVLKDQFGLNNMDDLATEMFNLMRMVRQDQLLSQEKEN